MIVKYAKDVRYSDAGIATHCGMSLPAVSTTHLADLTLQAEQYDVVGIDEGQFFTDTVAWAEQMANKGKFVVIAALDGDFRRQPFGDILSLIPLAETVTKLNAVCMNCFGDAAFSKRITLSDGEKVEVIGGADKYMAVCRTCYNSDVRVAASPRCPLKTSNKLEDAENNVSPAKKMLFSSKAEENKSDLTASAV